MKMNNKKITCPRQFKEQIVNYYQLFGYRLIVEKDLFFSRKSLEFEKMEENKKKDGVMIKHNLYPFLTYFPLVIGCFLLLVLATLFLIFTLRDSGNRLTYFLYFMVPVFVLLPLMAAYTFMRFYFDSKNIQILTSLDEIKKEMEE